MRKIYIKEALSAGWYSFTCRPLYLLGLSLAMSALLLLTSSQYAFATALAYIVYGGFLAVLIRHFNGEQVVFDDLFSLDNRWISFAFLGVIKWVLIILGLFCLIVPGVYLMVRWIFAELLVIDQGMRPLEALRASSKMTEGVRWQLLLFLVISAVLMLAGLLAFVIGVLVASLVITFALIRIYRDIKEGRS